VTAAAAVGGGTVSIAPEEAHGREAEVPAARARSHECPITGARHGTSETRSEPFDGHPRDAGARSVSTHPIQAPGATRTPGRFMATPIARSAPDAAAGKRTAGAARRGRAGRRSRGPHAVAPFHQAQRAMTRPRRNGTP
jgi:hypothetical protein